MDNAKFKDLWWDDELEEVYEEIDDGWRHGNDMYTVFKYGDDYWGCSYRVSGDGEYHGIRENDFTLTKVYPVTKITKTVDWTTDMPNPNASNNRYVRTFHEVEAIQFPASTEDAKRQYQDIISGDYTNLMMHVNGLEAFENWFERNDPEALVRFGKDVVNVVTDGIETVYPGGTWFVKEPGRPVYGLAPEIFNNLYEKA